MSENIEVRDLRQGGWIWIDKKILFSEHVTPSQYKVYSGLAAIANNDSQSGKRSVIDLAKSLHMGKSTVIRALQQLEALELLNVKRADGYTNTYELLKIERDQEIGPPKGVKSKDVPKQKSRHQRFIEFFYSTTQSARGIKPIITGKDGQNLKRILKLEILGEDQIEQLALYFLCDRRFSKFSPTISTFLSAGILNGLMDIEKNDGEFWSRMREYQEKYMPKTDLSKEGMDKARKAMQEQLAALRSKMTAFTPKENQKINSDIEEQRLFNQKTYG